MTVLSMQKIDNHHLVKTRWHYYRLHYLTIPRFYGAVVVMIDGVQHHGGLADRFRHILSIYSYCKEHQLNFKLHYIYPCDLSLFLLPNEYDWCIDNSQLSYSVIDSLDVNIYLSSSMPSHRSYNWQLSIMDECLPKKHWKQIHVYGNSCFAEKEFFSLFRGLFKPSPLLSSRIAGITKSWEKNYESVVLRFQSLLGDLVEGDHPTLGLKERDALINRCINKILELYEDGYFSSKHIFVTSDSSSFIERISHIPFVYVVKGKRDHMDFTSDKDADIEVQIKPFEDLFLLKQSCRITLLQTGRMYNSGFPRFAASVGRVPFNYLQF